MAEEEDPELTSSHGHIKITIYRVLLMRKTGIYQKRSSATKNIKKKPQQDG